MPSPRSNPLLEDSAFFSTIMRYDTPWYALSIMLTGAPQQTRANKQAIESLAPRVKALSTSLCKPVSGGDSAEGIRRKELEQ